MYVRAVRFTDVSAERMEGLLARIEESGGPPPGIPATGLTILADAEQGSAVVLQYFAGAADMEAGARGFEAMDASETPGVRASPRSPPTPPPTPPCGKPGKPASPGHASPRTSRPEASRTNASRAVPPSYTAFPSAASRWSRCWCFRSR